MSGKSHRTNKILVLKIIFWKNAVVNIKAATVFQKENNNRVTQVPMVEQYDWTTENIGAGWVTSTLVLFGALFNDAVLATLCQMRSYGGYTEPG
jgi:hypothetical protein